MRAKKVFIFGMDCMAPQLVFEEWRSELPNLSRLMEEGAWGEMKSTIPPITVPAWTAMMTSKDPGTLGFYGFRNRKGYGYDDLYFANASYVKEKTLWQVLSRNRLSSVVLGVPQTYPPKPLNGTLVASFLTPSKEVQYTWPDEAKHELDRIAEGDYIIDVKDFRTDDKERLLEQITVMTRRRFKVVREWVKSKPWDFFIFVEMGVDRIHHGFWRYHDKGHRLYEKGHRFEFAIRDYYRYLDGEIGRVLDLLPEGTQTWVVSDHGARTMHGAVCVNELFRREGLLHLKEEPTGQCPLKTSMIDWSRTACWGEGGYYSRIFLNVKGREPQGTVEPADYEKVRDRIRDLLEGFGDDQGRPMGTRAFKPEEIYRTVNGVPPDLIVYFGDLAWRSAGSVGTGAIHVFENDTGPDDANHAQYGMFILKGPGVTPGRREGVEIYDVAPTVLRTLGVDVPEDMIGNVVG
ncbi:MAG: alkaline phosphatase family protein [Acidobacteriota bacterium]